MHVIRWSCKMEVVDSRESRDIREKRDRGRENAFLQHVRAAGVREKEKKDTGRQRRRRCEVDSRRGVERKRGEKTRGWESFEYFANLVSRVEIAHARISSWETCSPLSSSYTLPFSFFHSRFLSSPLFHPLAPSALLHRGTKSFANRLRCGISKSSECQLQL